MKSFIIRALIAFQFISAAQAYEVKTVCATYLPTGAEYEVSAQIYDGSELQERTGEYFAYSGYKKYVVIFWAGGQASVIELDFSFGPTAFGSEGEDRSGRPWGISTSTVMCGV